MERAALDYSLLSSQHKIYPKILQFDREWKTVLMKNLQKLPSKYSVSRTFGIGPEDFRKEFKICHSNPITKINRFLKNISNSQIFNLISVFWILHIRRYIILAQLYP